LPEVCGLCTRTAPSSSSTTGQPSTVTDGITAPRPWVCAIAFRLVCSRTRPNTSMSFISCDVSSRCFCPGCSKGLPAEAKKWMSLRPNTSPAFSVCEGFGAGRGGGAFAPELVKALELRERIDVRVHGQAKRARLFTALQTVDALADAVR
jgi:hypothetical protein